MIDPSLVADSEVYWTVNGRGTNSEWTQLMPTGNHQEFRVTHNIPKLFSADAGFYSCHLITSYDRD